MELPYAKNVCIEYEKLQMQVDELNGLQSGLIRIGTFSSVATHWLPTHPDFYTIFLEQDKLLAVLPENHPLADCENFPVQALSEEPFILLEKGDKAEPTAF